MGSPLYNSLGGAQQNQNGIYNQFGGRQAFMQRLSNFAENFRRSSTVTPEQMVRQLMSSGQMTQDQFNQLSKLANSLMGR